MLRRVSDLSKHVEVDTDILKRDLYFSIAVKNSFQMSTFIMDYGWLTAEEKKNTLNLVNSRSNVRLSYSYYIIFVT